MVLVLETSGIFENCSPVYRWFFWILNLFLPLLLD